MAKGLSLLFHKAVKVGAFEAYEVGPDREGISHLQFAYDNLIMGNKSWNNIQVIKSILQLFELISGLKVNFYKSQIIGINIKQNWLEEAATQ